MSSLLWYLGFILSPSTYTPNAVNIEDEIMQMAMVLQQIKSRELRKAAIAQVKVLAEII